MKKQKYFYILVILLTPLLIITTGMRMALSPVFINIEYRLPNFPPDQYGFSLSDRLYWADFSIDFIAGKIDKQTFSSATLSDGSPLFNGREISHMVDVRNLTVAMLWTWRFLALGFAILLLLYRKEESKNKLFHALSKGAKTTLGIIAVILIFLAINFNQLFTAFHRIFFEGDTWLFFYTDSLIRLFPLKFWQDLFIFIGMLSVGLSLLFIFIDKKVKDTVRS